MNTLHPNIRIGTRGSLLALWQAEHVAQLLQTHGLATELVTIETKGDQILDRTLAKVGSKGIFTEELEQQLHERKIDIAVHSAKDMPSSLGEGLYLLAFTEREQVQDVILSKNPDFSLESGQPFSLGTSSVRRMALFRHFYPHIETITVRGNLQTRLRKMEEGPYDGLVLAWAGVHRMAMEQHIVQHLPVDRFIPAVGQGSIAIEASESLPTTLRDLIRQATNHPATETCLLAERAFLRQLEGGCSIPAFALATLLPSGQLQIKGGVVSPDGQQLIVQDREGAPGSAAAIGQALAQSILDSGGRPILQAIRQG